LLAIFSKVIMPKKVKTKKLKNKIITTIALVALVAAIITMIPRQQQARAQGADWTLTVNVSHVPFGENSIALSIKGPFGYTDSQNIANGPSPTTTFAIPAGGIPTGQSYQVCAGTGLLGGLLPACHYFRHEQDGDSQVSVSP
jgi:hypothetical protein